MFVVSHERFVTPLAAAAAPMPRGPGAKLGSDSGDRPPFLWDAAGAALLSPGTVLLGSRPPVSSRVRALRARFTESTSRRAVLTAESAPLSNGSQMRVLGAFNRVFSPYSVLHQHFLRLCFHGIKRSNF